MQVFIDNLEKQLQAYQELLKIADRKQQVLVQNDIEGLEKINQEEQPLIVKISKLEKNRLSIIGALEKKMGNNVPKLTMQELIKEKEVLPYQEKMQIIFEKLAKVVDELRVKNEQNSQLIKESLKFINYTMDLVTQREREVTYDAGNKGNKPTSSSHILDQKA